MYIYPDNLKAKATMWLWSLKDLAIVGIIILYSVYDNQGRKWKVMYDSSIVARKKDGTHGGDEYKVEFVSPICEYADIPTIQEIVRQLRHAGAIAGEKCGIHVHVNAAPHNAKSLRNITNIMYSKEDLIYKASIAITDKVELFERIKDHYGVEVTYEQQANAMNVWHIAKYNTTAMQEGDALDDGWANWNGGGDVTYYDLPASEVGGKVVELAMSRLGHPYSQTYRGKDNYVDCSYLTLWCYRQVGIILPGTAAEQGRYLVEHNLTIAKEDLQPGDLVFWSYKPNGRFMNITHVGIYAGDGKVVDASYSKGKVVYRNLFDEDKQVLYGRPQ